MHPPAFSLFFFTATATSEIYTLSLHDALPICHWLQHDGHECGERCNTPGAAHRNTRTVALLLSPFAVRTRMAYSPASDRKSTRLNSSHVSISYAVFCLKKKK